MREYFYYQNDMKVISVNIAEPATVMIRGSAVPTGIFKKPVGKIAILRTSVEGDLVADLRVHGGEMKSVYSYASEHYPFWRLEYPKLQFAWGTFGENITTEGLLEPDVHIGAVYRIGGALLRVTQPRMPCSKLAARFGTRTIIRRFMKSRKSGIYFSVVAEGTVRDGDPITLESPGDPARTIVDVVDEHDRKK